MTRFNVADSPGTHQVSETVADRLIAALVPSRVLRASSSQCVPMPVARLRNLAADSSMLYDISRVDASGRVPARELLAALQWCHGARLAMQVSRESIVLQLAADGLAAAISRQNCVVIPAPARSVCSIARSDRLLLAAAIDYRVLVVYPVSTLNLMIKHYHRRVEQELHAV